MWLTALLVSFFLIAAEESTLAWAPMKRTMQHLNEDPTLKVRKKNQSVSQYHNTFILMTNHFKNVFYENLSSIGCNR